MHLRLCLTLVLFAAIGCSSNDSTSSGGATSGAGAGTSSSSGALATSSASTGGSGGNAAGSGGGGATIDGPGTTSGPVLIRVDQAGYPTAEPKRALVMTEMDASNTTFQILDSHGDVVKKGTIGVSDDHGPWNGQYAHVYEIALEIETPGLYAVASGGARSPVFHVDTEEALYGDLLANATYFYRAQRDGSDVDGSILMRQPSHLADAMATVYSRPTYANDVLKGTLTSVGGPVDVEGGWFDAGDYVKFVATTSYVEAVMLVTMRDHAMVAKGARLDEEADRGITWLEKMWDDGQEALYYQVGIGDGNAHFYGDHDPWRLPEADDALNTSPGKKDYYVKYRPVFLETPAGQPIAPNLAGRLVADFALCAQVYAGVDDARASRCLSEATHVFALADTSNHAKVNTVSPNDYYPETSWHDDMELGAAELAIAMNAAAVPPSGALAPSQYLSQAAHFAKLYIQNDSGGDTLNLYDTGALAHRELGRAIDAFGSHGGLDVQKSDLVGDLEQQLSSASSRAGKDPFALGIEQDNGDPTPHAFGLVLTADFYAEIGGTTDFGSLSRAQRGFAYGANAWGTTFVVGAGQTFPDCLHHQIANLVGSFDGKGALLLGAIVDGPGSPSDFGGLGFDDGMLHCPKMGDTFSAFSTKKDRYVDASYAWPSVEPALDYVALSLLFYASRIDKH